MPLEKSFSMCCAFSIDGKTRNEDIDFSLRFAFINFLRRVWGEIKLNRRDEVKL